MGQKFNLWILCKVLPLSVRRDVEVVEVVQTQYRGVEGDIVPPSCLYHGHLYIRRVMPFLQSLDTDISDYGRGTGV